MGSGTRSVHTIATCQNGHPTTGTPFCPQCGEASESQIAPTNSAPDSSIEMHDFETDDGPVRAHRHQRGGGWVADTATVASTAFVGRDASVFDGASVLDEASIDGTSWVSGDALVTDRARIGGDAEITGNAHISGDAQVTDDASVSGDARIGEYAVVGGNAQILGSAVVDGDTQVLGDEVLGDDGEAGELEEWERQLPPVRTAAERRELRGRPPQPAAGSP